MEEAINGVLNARRVRARRGYDHDSPMGVRPIHDCQTHVHNEAMETYQELCTILSVSLSALLWKPGRVVRTSHDRR